MFSSRADPESGSTGIRRHRSPQTLGLGLGGAGENMAQPNSSISKSYGIDIRSPESRRRRHECLRHVMAQVNFPDYPKSPADIRSSGVLSLLFRGPLAGDWFSAGGLAGEHRLPHLAA